MRIGPGDEVIVSAYTWLASAGAVLSVGAIPVLADIDETLMLDPEAFEAMIGPRTKAVIPTHMGGRPSHMGRIMEIARKHRIMVLEDACQAIGARFNGRLVGSIGDAGAFSFNQFKTIACGEGGALITHDRQIYERALYFHDMGCTFRAHSGDLKEPPFLGHTLRMNELLCAVLRVQLGRLNGILERLRQRYQWCIKAVEQMGGNLTLLPSNDREGECGSFVFFLFESSEIRERVEKRAREINAKCSMGSPINSDLHVYSNWKVLLDRQGGFCDAMNPYMRAENAECRKIITPDSCRASLDIMARASAFSVDPNWTESDCAEVVKALIQAVKEVVEG